jgi:hypothetical protein
VCLCVPFDLMATAVGMYILLFTYPQQLGCDYVCTLWDVINADANHRCVEE